MAFTSIHTSLSQDCVKKCHNRSLINSLFKPNHTPHTKSIKLSLCAALPLTRQWPLGVNWGIKGFF